LLNFKRNSNRNYLFMFVDRGGAGNAPQPGINQWTSTRLVKIMLNNIALGLITIEIYMGELSWARATARPACALAPPLFVEQKVLIWLYTCFAS